MAVSLSSTLNPNAPFFVPSAFLAAEDFSPEWWRLVHSSPAFRDYWLSERFDPDQDLFDFDDDELDYFFLPSDSSLFKQEENIPPIMRSRCVDLRPFLSKADLRDLATPKLRRHKFDSSFRREKAPKVVATSPKKSVMRKIQQPR